MLECMFYSVRSCQTVFRVVVPSYMHLTLPEFLLPCIFAATYYYQSLNFWPFRWMFSGFIVILTCIALVTSNVEHFWLCLLVILYLHILIVEILWVVRLLLVSCESYLYIPDASPSGDIGNGNFLFPQTVVYFFSSLMVSFKGQTFVILMKFNLLLIFPLWLVILGSGPRNLGLFQSCEYFFLCFIL